MSTLTTTAADDEVPPELRELITGIMGPPWSVASALSPRVEAAAGETWVADYWCRKCERETEHRCETTGHERDSSGDRKTCLTCGEYTEL